MSQAWKWKRAPEGAELVAVPGVGAEAIGVVAWWRLSGETRIDALNPALRDAGVDEKLLPEAPSSVLALSRAVAEQESPRTIVRALEGRGNWAILETTTGREAMTVQQSLRAYVEGDAVKFGGSTENHQMAAQIAAAHAKHLGQLDVRDVSRWIAAYTYGVLQAVGLRDTGGIYFVPASAVPAFQRVTAAIEGATAHRFYEIPVARADKAVAGVLAALERDAALAAQAMEEELDLQLLKKRGLVGRRVRCEEILSKVEGYEALLGRGLEDLRARLSSLRASFAAAALAAGEEG